MNPTTKNLIDGICMDLLPSFPTQVDFGIQPSKNPTGIFGAYQHGYRNGTFTKAELDNAIGNGPALTELVHRGNNPYGKNIVITTTWDDLPEEDEYVVERERTREHAASDMEVYATEKN